MEDDRLSRIENKLDKLSDAVVSIVRVEERMVSLFKKIDMMDERQKSMDGRLLEVEKTSISRGAIYRLLDKLAWLFIGGIVVYVLDRWLS
jgi:hypothetical protein